MKEEKVGTIKNIKYNNETNDMEITVIITDNKFKKKILRDFSLMGKLRVDEESLIYITNIKE
jgi:hypothetical protein